MDSRTVRLKFGRNYVADDRTFMMGIDQRFTTEIARRFRDRRVLETCTGGGFSTIALAQRASHVITVEINPVHQLQARQNIVIAQLEDHVTFVLADIMDEKTWNGFPPIDAAFLDPDWAITGPDHVHRFIDSSTRPPADRLLERTLRATNNVALVLPPGLDTQEFDGLPVHEVQRLYLNQSHELYCLYFGDLALSAGQTELRA